MNVNIINDRLDVEKEELILAIDGHMTALHMLTSRPFYEHPLISAL